MNITTKRLKELEELKELEFRPLREIRDIQEERFQDLLKRAPPIYGRYLREIKDLDDLTSADFFVYKDQLRTRGRDFLAVPLTRVSRIFSSSGTTGPPTYSYFTKEDLEVLDQLAWRAMRRMESPEETFKDDIAMIDAPSGMFMLNYTMCRMAYQSGLTIINPNGTLSEIVRLLHEFNPTVYMGYLSGILSLMESFKIKGGLERLSSIRKVILIGENLSLARREQLRILLNRDSGGLKVYDVYGMSEVCQTLSSECKFKVGMHMAIDHVFFEVIDPITHEHSKENKGILVITTLTKRADPLIRYWTDDYVEISYERCKCGRTLPRIVFVDKYRNMIRVGDEHIPPSRIEAVIFSGEFAPIIIDYQAVVKGTLEEPVLTIKLRTIKRLNREQISSLRDMLERALKIHVEHVEEESLTSVKREPTRMQKRQRVIDKRRW